MPDTPERRQANLPPDLLAGGKIAFVKRVPRGLDYGLDDYALDRFSMHFSRFGAEVLTIDEAGADASDSLLALCRDPSLLFVYSFNGAGGRWRIPFADLGVPFVVRVSNAFFAENSRLAVLGDVRVLLLRDRNSLAAAQALLPSGTMIDWLMGGALGSDDRSPPGDRPSMAEKDIPLLVATRSLDPAEWRAASRAKLGREVAVFDAALDAVVAGPEHCLASAVLAVLSENGWAEAWPRDRLLGFLALVNGTAIAIRRHRMLELTAGFPATYVFDAAPPPIRFHRQSTVLPRMENSDLVRLIARSRGYLCFNPNGMAGAFSERIGQAVERGTIPLLQENAVTAELFADGGGLSAGPDDDALTAAVDRLSDLVGLQEIADSGHAALRRHHTIDGYVATILQAAARRAPDGALAQRLRDP